MKKYIEILKKLNKLALSNGDVPVSCIIFDTNKIISKSYNMREKKNNPLLHAEILAIEKASKKLKTWNLSNCQMIVTLKPCNMCLEVIKNARIKKVYYILENNKNVNNKLDMCKLNCIFENEFSKEIKDFFYDKR